jgi:hypothetical protein
MNLKWNLHKNIISHGALMEKNKTIKQFKVDSSWDNREKALVFSYRTEFIKKFIAIAEDNFKFFVKPQQSLDSFIGWRRNLLSLRR